jgi:hypothetical protein
MWYLKHIEHFVFQQAFTEEEKATWLNKLKCSLLCKQIYLLLFFANQPLTLNELLIKPTCSGYDVVIDGKPHYICSKKRSTYFSLHFWSSFFWSSQNHKK